jgi:hypothetical protein
MFGDEIKPIELHIEKEIGVFFNYQHTLTVFPTSQHIFKT